jgi:hypothetical protein
MLFRLAADLHAVDHRFTRFGIAVPHDESFGRVGADEFIGVAAGALGDRIDRPPAGSASS